MAPEQLLELIPATRGRPCRVTPLEGGLTNRNYRVDLAEAGEGESYVLRLAGAGTNCLGINRECEVACSRAAAALDLTPEVVAFLPEHGAMLRRFISGRPLAPEELRRPEILRRVVAALRRYHDSPPGTGRFCAFETTRSYHAQARERGVRFPPTMEAALQQLTRMESALSTDDLLCPCHNDLLAANLIDGPTGLQIIDWEYAGMGDRFFDLGNLAVNNGFAEQDERALLELYFGRVDPRHLRRLRGMRLVSDGREALWGYLQAGLSQLTVDFLDYGQRHLDRFLAGATDWR